MTMLCIHVISWLCANHGSAQNVVFGSVNGSNAAIDLMSINSMVFHNNNFVVTEEHCGDRYFSVFATDYITLDGSVNVSDRQNINDLVLFPNPATNEVFINSITTPDCDYIIMNAAGKTLYSGVISSRITRINVSELASGIYFFQSGLTHKIFVKL